MTEPLAPPPRKDPQARTRTSLLPPEPRSRAALRMSAMAARGVFSLQVCKACGHIMYPARDACPSCLSADLAWRPVSDKGQVIAETTVRTSIDPYFRERTPWRVGTVALEAGPTVTAHLHRDVSTPGLVRMAAKLDKSGNAVLIALPAQETPHMNDDPILRELTATPKHRRVLVTDGRSAPGQATAHALVDAGAAEVRLGIATPWLPYPGQAEIEADAGIETIPLDLTSETSVRKAAAELGGKTDIIVNTAGHVRPGGVLAQSGLASSRDAFEAEVFGLQRLAQEFGPSLIARGADGDNAAVALVDVLSVHALTNWNAFGVHAAASAARHSLLQCLRGEMRTGGVRVLSVFTGPIEDDWHQPLPPPKVAPATLAKAVVHALEDGIEESFVGDIARDVFTRWQDDPKVLERELQA